VAAAVALLTLAICGASVAPADAYTLTGVRWDHPPTHTADPVLTQAFGYWTSVSGLTDGGVSASPDIDISSAPLAPGIGGYASWSSSDGTHTRHCSIVTNSLYPGSLVVYVHELGHCLGLGHSCEGGQTCSPLTRQAIMSYDGGTAALNADDIAGIQLLYGPPVAPPPPPPPPKVYRLRGLGVSRD